MKETLIEMARHNLRHATAGTIDQADTIVRVPASHYLDADRYRKEIEQVFKRMPLVVGFSSEFKNPGDFRTLTIADVPVLMVRHEDGGLRAYINSCLHRGAQIVVAPEGNAKSFACPYHAWRYNTNGELIGVFNEGEFGSFDHGTHGLVSLPIAERAGLVWVTLDPNSTLDIDTFLCGYDGLLDLYGFKDWALYDRREVVGPNWKVAYDGYMDLYHLPVLHRQTFGTGMPSQALYYAYGPHQRVSSPDPGLAQLAEKPESEWPTERLLGSVWTIFPHVSIANFDGGGGRAVMVSQLFPGENVGESTTVQNYLMEKLPTTDAEREAADAQFKLLEYVVAEEDYATGIRQQRALAARGGDVLFGRNEAGGQHFHQFVDRLIETGDDQLSELFEKED